LVSPRVPWRVSCEAGAFILVSHDRELIEHSCNRFWVINDGHLQEWPDAESAYQRLFAARHTALAAPMAAAPSPVGVAESADGEAEAQWQRWCQLEAWLAMDLARKPKHQKPDLQQQWRDEMLQLERALGL
jgi:ATPase subunit of ABC transporter with duplicated ATPase domains